MTQPPPFTTETPPAPKPTTARQLALRIAEIVLLIPAFSLLIPPVPSEPQTRYRLFPTLPIAAALFAASQLLAVRRGGEHWAPAALKILLFCGLGWLINVRTFGPP